MTLTYCGILLNIMIALCRIERNTNEYQDLLILQDITDGYNSSDVADVDALLKTFRDKTHLRLSIEDLYVYFSNMGTFKI